MQCKYFTFDLTRSDQKELREKAIKLLQMLAEKDLITGISFEHEDIHTGQIEQICKDSGIPVFTERDIPESAK